MVKITSNIAHGCTHTQQKQRKLLAILQLIGHVALVNRLHLSYWTSSLLTTVGDVQLQKIEHQIF